MRALRIAVASLTFGCGSAQTDNRPARQTTAVFDLSNLSTDHFFDAPFPSDARMDPAGGGLNLAGFPNPRGFKLVAEIIRVAGVRRGVSVLPVTYFRFDGPLAKRSATEVIAAAATSPVLLIDVDEKSSERGKLLPTVAYVTVEDPYLQEGTIAVAPVPGIVLRPNRRYAVVIRGNLGDASGNALRASDAWKAIEDGASVQDGYAPWRDALRSEEHTSELQSQR